IRWRPRLMQRPWQPSQRSRRSLLHPSPRRSGRAGDRALMIRWQRPKRRSPMALASRMLAMLPEITVQLAGRVGRWHPRHVHGQARTVWSAWLHAPQHGILGVYVLAKPNAPLTEALPGNQWVHLRGVLRPLRVLALPDDPRAAD